MKRSRHRWLGFSLFCLSVILATELPAAWAVRATSLIFSKTTSTTAAPEEQVLPAQDATQTEATEEGGEATNKTSKYTGVPQVDYIYDPNLPRELNGYNLSEYPFLASVPPPETMKFKCDGLHDGFYASIDLKCQVYHHCIYGIRHDFLCANYTAFDQKTFICQFVSVVDCKNSANYFSRNDALYKATTAATPPPTPSTTTTTTTPRPSRPGGRRRPYYRYDYYDDDEYYPARDDYEYEERGTRNRPRPRPQGRPGKRRQYEYDDDRYEPRPRPAQPRDEAEEDYEDRRPYEERRRPGKRYNDQRRPYDDDRRPSSRRPRPRDDEESYDPDDDRPRSGQRDQKRDDIRPRDEESRSKDEPRRNRDEIRPRDEEPRIKDGPRRNRDEIRPRDEELANRDEELTKDEPKRSYRDQIRPRNEEPRIKDEPRRVRDEKRPRDEIRPRDESKNKDEARPRDESRSKDDIRPRDEIRPRDDVSRDDEKRPRDEVRSRDEIRPRDQTRTRDEIKPRDERRPIKEDNVQEIKPKDSSRTRGEDRFNSEARRYERPYRNRDDRPLKPEKNDDDERSEVKRLAPTAPEGTPLVKPSGHGIFGQPRMPPKIKRPVPANEKAKFDYVPIVTTKAPSKYDDEYYDDYEDEEPSRPSSSGKTSTIQQKPRPEPVEKERFKPSRPHFTSPATIYKSKNTPKPLEYEEEYYDEPPVKSQKYTHSSKVRDERPFKPKPINEDYYYDYDDKRVKTNTRNVDEDIPERIKDSKPNVKVIKRPFLPSRGGSPYLPRGLQPVAGKILGSPPLTTPKPTTTSTTTTTTTTPRPTKTTTTPIPTTTTTKETTTVTTEKLTTGSPKSNEEFEEEYYDEDDIDYDAKLVLKPVKSLESENEKENTSYVTTHEPEVTSEVVTNTKLEEGEEDEDEAVTETEDKAKNLASKVLRTYTDNYEAIQKQLESTLTPGDYLKPYLATQAVPLKNENHQTEAPFRRITLEPKQKFKPLDLGTRTEPFRTLLSEPKQNFKPLDLGTRTESYKPNKKPEPYVPHKTEYKPFDTYHHNPEVFKPISKAQPKPDVFKPYTATGKPVIPENISIKQNLADSVENDYDVRFNEALAPNLPALPPKVNVRTPSGFVVPVDKEYYPRFRSNFQQAEPQYAASELATYQLRTRPQVSGVIIRTPSSYFLQPQRLYQDDGIPRHPRQLVYRQQDFF